MKDLAEALNSAVRPVVVIMLAYSLCHALIISNTLTNDAFIAIASGVFGYYFRAREDEKREKATTDAVKAAAVETAAAIKNPIQGGSR